MVARPLVMLVALAILLGTAQVARAEEDGCTYVTPEPIATHSEWQNSVDTIPLSDGEWLSAAITIPTPGEKFPTVLTMTPYGKRHSAHFTPYGWARVVADVRGTGNSSGEFCLFCEREQRDAYELIDWIARQDWSDGTVVMAGGSYGGILSLLAAAQKHPALKAISVYHAYADIYREATWHNGMFSSIFVPQWTAYQTGASYAGTSDPAVIPHMGYEKMVGEVWLNEWDGPWYQERSIYPRYDDIEIPALFFDGWFDGFSRGALWNFEGIASKDKYLVMDPFGHHWGKMPFEPTSRWAHEFADNYEDGSKFEFAWLDQFVRGIDNGIRDGSTIRYFDLGAAKGEDSWKCSPHWPPPGSRTQDFYLSGEESGSATSLNDGTLSSTRPTNQDATSPDTYIYEPTHGVSETFGKWGEVAVTPQIHVDQRPEEAKSLTYSTPQLREPLELAGPMELRFWATTTASDTDWVIKVSDVAPDGESVLMTTGYLQASHRKVDESRSKPAEPWIANDEELSVPKEEPVEYRVDVWPTAWTIQAGHRLRVTIASSDVPNHTASPHPAVNTVLHDAVYSSRLIVTVAAPGRGSPALGMPHR